MSTNTNTILLSKKILRDVTEQVNSPHGLKQHENPRGGGGGGCDSGACDACDACGACAGCACDTGACSGCR